MSRFYQALLLLFLIGQGIKAYSQCAFQATINPNNLILCPNEQDTIKTQAYDTYQWYKNGAIVTGAKKQFLVVDQFLDAGAYFSVLVTDTGCTEMSDTVLVDGWAFLPIFVIHTGDLGTPDGLGNILMKCGDTLILTVGLPYDTNIVWTKNGSTIPGANGISLAIGESGSWGVSGSPKICPNFSDALGVTLATIFPDAVKPVITQINDTLFTSGGSMHQWFFEGSPIPGATDLWHVPASSGVYTVSAVDSNNCEGFSDPFIVELTGIGLHYVVHDVKLYPNPTLGKLIVKAPGAIQLVQILTIHGRLVLASKGQSSKTMELDLSELPLAVYLVKVIYIGGTTQSLLLRAR